MKVGLFVLVGLLLCVAQIVADRPWMNVKDTPNERAHKLLAQMTLDEKLDLVHGYPGPYVGDVPVIKVGGNAEKQIPALHLEDGPQGVADGVKLVTCWPSALTVISTWDPSAMYQFAAAMGQEQRGKGTNVMLGPMVNLARVPMGGRNFESFGEDPYLAAQMVEQSIYGIQNQSVIATVKHWVDNNQELNRTTTSANVDERTQFEIYYPAFEAAVNAGVGAVMCSYNRINDAWACENEQTLTIDLKGRLGFRGWVMSDWGATHSTAKAANAGLDMQMPDDSYFGAKLKEAVNNGQVKNSRVDDMVLRILTPMFAMGLFDLPNPGNLSVNVETPAHDKLARDLAIKSTVLMKNDKNILPLSTSKTIAVIGDAGDKAPIVAGGGSGHVIAPYIVTGFQGIGNRTSSKVTYAPSTPLNQAVAAAKSADVAVVFVATTSSEGHDRPNLSLGNGQDELVAAVAAAQPNTIVVVNAPSAVLMPWHASVPGILFALMPGQEAGNAIAAVLFGDYNPSGRLPVTFPQTEDQIPVNTPQQYPGINQEASYSEKLLVGYRWYDAKNQNPLFPFGHGLSYTTFHYSNMQIDGTTVSFKVTNSGSVAGSEVVQAYLGFPESAGEPPKILRFFDKVQLAPQQSKTFSVTFSGRDFSIWEITSHHWKEVKGYYNVFIGSSSRDIRLKGILHNV